MESFITDLSFLLVACAVMSLIAVFLKQPIVVAYIFCGMIVGPWGLGIIKNAQFIEMISRLGVTLLLFLAGLCLHPQKLLMLFRKSFFVVLTNCVFSFISAFWISQFFGFNNVDSLCIGLALMFSSTILVVKLLPTTALHQRRMGAICIGVLILQDLLAVGTLAFVRFLNLEQGTVQGYGLLLAKLLLLVILLFIFEYFVLRKVMFHIDRIHEALFVLGLAWCFGVATVSHQMGLFYETGAFFAGVVLARHKISFFISEKLKPLRDFFLVLFFFALGAKLDILIMPDIFIPAAIMAIFFIIFKPIVFKLSFMRVGESKAFSQEVGIRLGQLSEFSLLIAILAFNFGYITNRAAQFIQLVTILTFVFSSYIVILRYPTPIGMTEKLNRD